MASSLTTEAEKLMLDAMFGSQSVPATYYLGVSSTQPTEAGGNVTEPATSGAITAFADAGGGQVTVTSAGHGLSNGNSVTISGTTNYDGVYTISNVATDTFEITATWVSDDATGQWLHGLGGYARVAITNGIGAGQFLAAVGGDPSSKKNNGAKTFPQATADWLAGADITHILVWDDPTATAAVNLMAFIELTTARPILQNDTFSVPDQELNFTLD